MNNDTPLDMLQIKIERAKESLPKETLKAIDSVDWRAYILGMREKKGYSFEQLEDLELETELLLCGLLNPVNYPKELEERLKLPRPQVDLLVNEMNEFVFKKIKDELIKNSERREIFVKRTEDMIPAHSASDIASVDKPAQIVKQGIESPTLSNNTNIEVMPEELTTPNIKTNEVINKSETKVLEKAGIEINPASSAPSTTMVGRPVDKVLSTAPLGGIIEEKKAGSISSQKLSGSFQIPTIKTEYSLNNLSKQGEATTPTDGKTKISKVDPYRLDPNE